MDKRELENRISKLEFELSYLKKRRNTEKNITIETNGQVAETTGAKQLTESLTNADKLLDSIIEHSPNALWISDQHGTLIRMNQACRDVLLLRNEEVVGKYNILKDSVLEAKGVMPLVQDVFNKGKVAHFLVEYDTGKVKGLCLENTVKLFLHVSISPIVDDNGKVTNVIVQHVDFTKHKMAEDALKESEKKLQKLNSDKDRFISIIGHDLIGPFNPILGLLQLLSQNLHNYNIEKTEKIINAIHSSAYCVYNLLQETLDWVHVQSGQIPFEPQKLNFDEICSDIIDILTPSLIKKNITINFFSLSNSVLFADKNMIKTILRNLVSNAIKFTNVGGKINLCTEEGDKGVIISVSDDGIGIAPEDQRKLFDDSALFSTEGTGSEKGSGLGLIICKEFVKKHGGEIWVESDPGKGSNFRFSIPCIA